MSRLAVRRTLRALLAVGALATTMSAAAAPAGAVTVNFDGAPASVGASANTVYATTPGVRFGDATPQPVGGQIRGGNTCGVVVEAQAGAPSGPNVGRLSCGGTAEFPDPPSLLVRFTTATRTSASIRVGHRGNSARTMNLAAFDSAGRLISRSPNLTTTTTGTTFSVSGGSPEIMYLLLDAVNDATGAVWIDDLVFDTPPVAGRPTFDVIRGGSGTLNLIQGGPARTAEFTLLRINGSNGQVAYTVRDLPRGVTATQRASVNGTTLEFTADPRATVTGSTDDYVSVTVAPTSAGAGTVSQTFTIGVRTTAAIFLASVPDVSLPSCAAIPLRYNVAPHAGPATWTVSGLPTGVTATIDGQPVTATTGPTASNAGTANLELQQTSAVGAPTNLTIGLKGSFYFSELDRASDRYEATTGMTVRPLTGISASPTSVRTPQQLQPGTTVTIEADGLCTTERADVQFGNEKARAAVTGGPTTRVLRVQVPRAATSGPVRVIPDRNVPAVGVDGPFITVDSYRNTVGFAFPNYKPTLTVDQMSETFGYDATHYSPNVCSGISFGLIDCEVSTPLPDPWARTVLTIANLTMGGSSGGACFGYSRTSQQLRLGRRTPQQMDNATARNAFELDYRGGAGGRIQETINAGQLAQLSSEYLDFYSRQAVGNLLSQNYKTLRREVEDLIRRNDHPLISLRDGGSLTSLHVVVAYDVYDDGEGFGGYYIDVLDSNAPFGQPGMKKGYDETAPDGETHARVMAASRIHVRPNNTWSLPSSSMGASTMANIIVGGLDMPPAKPKLIGGKQALKNGLTILLGWTAAGILSQDGTVKPPPSRVTQVTSGNRKLYSAPGVLNADPATALRATPWAPAGAGVAAADGVILAAGPGAEYEVEMTGDKPGEQTRMVLGNDVLAQVTTETRQGVPDKLSVDPQGNAVGFAPGGTGSASLDVDLMVRAADGSTRTAEVETKTAAKSEDTVSFDKARGGIVIEHEGPPTTVDLTLSSTTQAGLPQTIETKVPVGRNATTVVKPSSWKQLTKSKVSARTGRSTRTLKTRRKGAAAAKVTKLTVTGKGAARTAQATVKLARATSAGGVTVSFAVKRGRKTIGQFAAPLGGTGTSQLSWPLPADVKKGDRLVVVATTVQADRTTFTGGASAKQRKL